MRNTIEIHDGTHFFQKLISLNWALVFLISSVAAIGFAALYSAAGGSFDPWASDQMLRFFVFAIGMCLIALFDIRFWQKLSYLCYAIGIILLVIVEIKGHVGMGAQRWIALGPLRVQPSELMKIAVIMALARYYHSMNVSDARYLKKLVIPAVLIALPVFLVLLQPDLGTAISILIAGAATIFVAGAPVWLYIAGGVFVLASMPIIWKFGLHEYQRQRVLTFLNPESDPLGAGYHITQSKIALGSGGVSGRGYLQGSQSHLNFLPEKHTDFIFTLWGGGVGTFGRDGDFAALRCYFPLLWLDCFSLSPSFRANSRFWLDGQSLALCDN